MILAECFRFLKGVLPIRLYLDVETCIQIVLDSFEDRFNLNGSRTPWNCWARTAFLISSRWWELREIGRVVASTSSIALDEFVGSLR
jgi:hypothetical protein